MRPVPLSVDATVLNDLALLKKAWFTINHKKIAINYYNFSLISGLAGTTLASFIRLELSKPGSHYFKGDSTKYLQVITCHGLVMIFFVVIPIIFGVLANFFIPFHIGAKDVALPRLNSLGFWILPGGFLLFSKPSTLRMQVYRMWDPYPVYIESQRYTSFVRDSYFETSQQLSDQERPIKKKNLLIQNLLFLPTNWNLGWSDLRNFKMYKKVTIKELRCSSPTFTTAGWTFITPFSSSLRFTGPGAQDAIIFTTIIAGISSTLSFTNLLLTRRCFGSIGLKNRKNIPPFLSISLFLVMRMLSLITPVLGGAMLMLLTDRHALTAFFDYAFGGDLVLFHHLFWFFGHPEVYVVIIPAFGIVNYILPFYNNRRITSKNHLVWATYVMAYMGFLVWGHHMYLVGLDHRSRSLYSTVTVMISLPAVVKIVNWTLTFMYGAIKLDSVFSFISAFIFFFISGGLTGLWLSHVSLNVFVHDTFYVVAHFHFMFSAATFSALFGAIYFFFKKLFGLNFNSLCSFAHLVMWKFGQWVTFTPLYWIGYNGLPRRYHDYPVFFLGWHAIATSGHSVTLLGLFFFYAGIIEVKIRNAILSLEIGVSRWYRRIQFYITKEFLLKTLPNRDFPVVVVKYVRQLSHA